MTALTAALTDLFKQCGLKHKSDSKGITAYDTNTGTHIRGFPP